MAKLDTVRGKILLLLAERRASCWAGNAYRVRFACRRDFLNKAYSRTSSRSALSRSAVALSSAFVRDFGFGSGKKAVIGTLKNRASFSKSEMDGLWVAVSHREIVLAVVPTACAKSS